MERRRQFYSVLAAGALVIALCAIAGAQYGGGSGTADDPYLIYTPEQMNAIGADPNDWDQHFKLTADIDLSQYTGTEFNLIGVPYRRHPYRSGKPFTGVFDGNGHVISNFRYACHGEKDIGLFRWIADPNAVVKRVRLVNVIVGAGTGDYVGSLVGDLEAGTVTECYATGFVKGNKRVGGLVGHGDTITACYANAAVIGHDYVGGLAGSAGAITDSYAHGTVIGSEYVGGLVGYYDYIKDFAVTHCYATAFVIGASHTGGLVGCDIFPDIRDEHVVASFWDVETSRQPTSAGGERRTTVQMQTLSTFLAWREAGSEVVWTIDEGNDYPRLAWENRPGIAIEPTPLPNLLPGTGIADDPYLIYNAGQLALVGQTPDDWDKHYKLMADIDLALYADSGLLAGSGLSIHLYNGTFDGNGHIISNFTYVADEQDYGYAGLFVSICGDYAEVRNLRLRNVIVKGDSYVGALAAQLQRGTIINCYVEGGLVTGKWNAGGLVGHNHGGTIRQCASNTLVLGGGTDYQVTAIGGLVGHNDEGIIKNCYARGPVVGDDAVGGLVGENDDGRITACYATGAVSGSLSPGGLVGWPLPGHAPSSFWCIETSGQQTSAGGTGLTTAEMMTAAPFLAAGWDFIGEAENGTEEIWWIEEGADYPRLWWEAADAEF